MFNRGHIVKQDHAVRRRAQHSALDLVELFKTRVRNDEVKFVVLLEPADCHQNIRGGQCTGHFGQRHLERLQFVWIDSDAVLFDPTALNADARDS